jgi:pyruvate/2-oxoglutarate dehydrogenase complex dihydrolipoamide dehydrogenase (E3) component
MHAGRDPLTRQLGLEKVGVEVDKEGYVVGGHGGDHEKSSVSHIYAIGDILKVLYSLCKANKRN